MTQCRPPIFSYLRMKARGLIFGTRISWNMHVFVCASMCEFRGQNSVKGGGGGGENVKPGKNSFFLKNGKTVILIENQQISRSRMMKQTSPLNSSREI